MRSEVKEVCEQSEQCTIFLCISWEGRFNVHGTHEAFEVCNSLKKWEEVIFVMTLCDRASGDANEIEQLRDQWKKEIKEKLISMGVEEEVANDAVTERIIFSSCDPNTSKIVPNLVDPDWPTSLVKSVMKKFSGRRKEIFTSFATSLLFALRNNAQCAHSSDSSVVDVNQPNQNIEDSLHSSGIRHRGQSTQLPPSRQPPGEEIGQPTQLPPPRQPPGKEIGRPSQLPPRRQREIAIEDTSCKHKSVLPYALTGGVLAGVAGYYYCYCTDATVYVSALAGGGTVIVVTAATLLAAYIWYNVL